MCAVLQSLLTLMAPDGMHRTLREEISKVDDGPNEPKLRQFLMGVAWKTTELVSLAVMGVVTLGFQLRGQRAKKENTRILMVSSVASLLAINYILWQCVVIILVNALKSSRDGRVSLIFLSYAVGILTIAADIAVLAQLAGSRSLSHEPQVLSTDLQPETSTIDVASPITVNPATSEPATPPYIPNLFRTTTDPIEICSQDFNSWRSLRLPSTSESFDDRYETVIEQANCNGGRQVQVVKVNNPSSESGPNEQARVNVCGASGSCGTLFMGPLDEESGGGTNRSSCAGYNLKDEPVVGLSSRKFLPKSAPEAQKSSLKIYALIKNMVNRFWNSICEDETFRFSVWAKAAGLTCAIALMYSCVYAIGTLQGFAHEVSGHSSGSHSLISVDQFEDYPASFGSDSDDNLVTSGQSFSAASGFPVAQAMLMDAPEGQEMRGHNGFILKHSDLGTGRNLVLIHSHYVTKLASFFLAVMGGFYYTVVVGYVISTYIGFWSLYQVFAKQKELIIKLNREAAASCQGEICFQSFWQGSRPRYRISGAVYFLGTLVSTALIQQHILGVSIATVLAIAASINDIDCLLNTCNIHILLSLGVLMVTLVLSHALGNYVLVDGMNLAHPRWFFLYVFTFSLGNFVLGAFHGLYRLFYLLLSTFTALSRLDVSSFQSARGLDNGHNTFMSMVLLTQKAQRVVSAPAVINRN